MKRISLVVCSLWFLNTGAQTITWFGPVTVANGATYGNTYPRINLVSGNKPIVTWGKSSTNELFSAVWNTSAFNAPIQLNPSGVDPYVQTWTGPETATSGDTVFTAFSTQPAGTGKIYMVKSVDGGMTFTDTVRVDNVGTNYGWIPAVAVLPWGNPIISFMRHDAAYDSIDYVTTKSLDGGLTFLPEVNASASSPGVVCDCCPSAIVSSGNTVVQVFRNAESNIRTMYGAFSFDGGNTFPAVNEIDLTGWTSGICPSSGPSGVIVGDSLLFVWMSKAGGPTRVYIGTVNIYDQQVGINRQIFPTASGTQNYPVIAARGDTVAVVWEHNSSGVTDISFSWSLTGAAGIGSSVDTLTGTFPGNQTRPDIVFNDRKFHIAYSDATGTEVKYLEGIIDSGVGLDEKPIFNNVNAFYANGKIVMQVESSVAKRVLVQVINTGGQQVAFDRVNLDTGENTITLNGSYSTGVYTISIADEQGGRMSTKLTIH
ncbi:MAG TPA: hypothetical protein VD905_02035 [Flavobacteriales bacterium]|nr:hypothetical protein [Flavobacteriales bacterium]